MKNGEAIFSMVRNLMLMGHAIVAYSYLTLSVPSISFHVNIVCVTLLWFKMLTINCVIVFTPRSNCVIHMLMHKNVISTIKKFAIFHHRCWAHYCNVEVVNTIFSLNKLPMPLCSIRKPVLKMCQ